MVGSCVDRFGGMISAVKKASPGANAVPRTTRD